MTGQQPAVPLNGGAPEEKPAHRMDALPDGEFYLVIRVVRGRVELFKDSLPAKPVKEQTYRELKRVKLTTAQSRATVTQFYKQFATEIAALQAKLDREAKG